MRTRNVECQTNFRVTYDENSPEFKEALSSYQECIYSLGDEDDMIQHVAHNILRFGIDRMVEGVGYVKTETMEEPPENWSGITIDEEEPEFNFEIW